MSRWSLLRKTLNHTPLLAFLPLSVLLSCLFSQEQSWLTTLIFTCPLCILTKNKIPKCVGSRQRPREVQTASWLPHKRIRCTILVLRGGSLWTLWSSTRPSAKPCTWVGAIQSTNTGWEKNGLRAVLPRRTCGCWLTGSSTQLCNVHSEPRKLTIPWAPSKAAWPAGRWRWFCPSVPLWWDATWSPTSSSGALSTRRTWNCWSRSRGGPWRWSKWWNTSPVRKGWESWGYLAWRREGSREILWWCLRPGWMGLWATWSSGRCYCPWQGAWN